ncbi:DHH family phosphoesterase [Patescibacteria group bacterium]|nr:DHH family phosphoesterase [Patescibacteria group bacterium]
MHNHKAISQSIFQLLEKSQDVLLISHQKPDGDTLGSSLALFSYLSKLNKNVSSFCTDPVPDNLEFLPNSYQLTTDHLVFTKKYDLVITLDSSNLDYAGINNLMSALPLGYTLINIDHHISNPLYGDINLVIDSASSTSEVVYRLLKDWYIQWDKDIATCLIAGIITDTDGFKNGATNYQALAAASDLIAYGAKTQQIIKNSLNKINIESLKLWGIALERLKKIDKHNIVYTWITQDDFKNCQANENASDGLANFLHILKEGQIIMVLTERADGTVKGSLRTTSNIDLTKLAALFGGGGHKKAAGFSLPGKLVYDNNKLRII